MNLITSIYKLLFNIWEARKNDFDFSKSNVFNTENNLFSYVSIIYKIDATAKINHMSIRHAICHRSGMKSK